jgi:transcriptional regulator with XRE-family HTH domain
MRKLTVRALAEAAGASPSLISQIENGRARPSIDTLLRIANVFGVGIGDIVAGVDTVSSHRVVRKKDRPSIEWGTESAKYLLTRKPFQTIEAYELILAPGDELAKMAYPGSFALLIAAEGSALVTIDGVADTISEGDTIMFWTEETHNFVNETDSVFRGYFVLSPPATPAAQKENRGATKTAPEK